MNQSRAVPIRGIFFPRSRHSRWVYLHKVCHLCPTCRMRNRARPTFLHAKHARSVRAQFPATIGRVGVHYVTTVRSVVPPVRLRTRDMDQTVSNLPIGWYGVVRDGRPGRQKIMPVWRSKREGSDFLGGPYLDLIRRSGIVNLAYKTNESISAGFHPI